MTRNISKINLIILYKMEGEVVKKLPLIIRIIKHIKCKFKCCSGSQCQLGEYDEEPHPAVETRDFEDI